ncbi:unnamed protein product [Haemonchus placei]|uniref:Uncharacterized protein n=1 Tax=Haemonchus placei TaxID=6290 RepID=A0A3P7VZF5_HAEPC|nr:unnamed protein product [Haemonchus placei]
MNRTDHRAEQSFNFATVAQLVGWWTAVVRDLDRKDFHVCPDGVREPARTNCCRKLLAFFQSVLLCCFAEHLASEGAVTV